jgi:hypothetical protein
MGTEDQSSSVTEHERRPDQVSPSSIYFKIRTGSFVFVVVYN